MFTHQDALSYMWTDALGYKFYKTITGAFEPLDITGTVIFKGIPPLLTVSDNENSLGPISNARIIQDPYMDALTDNATETIIEISFLNTIDVFFLGNVNFDDFTITANSIDSDSVTFENPNTGQYNGICFFTTAGINTFTLTIPGQAPNDGQPRFIYFNNSRASSKRWTATVQDWCINRWQQVCISTETAHRA